MNLTEIKKDLTSICKGFKLGKLKSFETKKNYYLNEFNTVFFTVENDLKIYKYHFKK